MMDSLLKGDQPLWVPSKHIIEQANITRYQQWLADEKGLHFTGREELWQWSVTHIEEFWSGLWDFFHIQASQPYTTILTSHAMPGAEWFPEAMLNYAEHVFLHATNTRPAIIWSSERHAKSTISWQSLSQQVAAIASALRQRGVRAGDRVVAYMPNIPQTIVAFLACASIGAIWSSCSPDFGTQSVIERFQQIEPTVLIAVDGYQYQGKRFDRRPIIAELQHTLTTLHTTILVPYLNPEFEPGPLDNLILWTELFTTPGALTFEQVPFQHPLWILYSSGTTGLPKAIVQSHGGILLEHLKNLTFDLNLAAISSEQRTKSQSIL